MCGKGNRNDPVFHLAGVIRYSSQHRRFYKQHGNFESERGPDIVIEISTLHKEQGVDVREDYHRAEAHGCHADKPFRR